MDYMIQLCIQNGLNSLHSHLIHNGSDAYIYQHVYREMCCVNVYAGDIVSNEIVNVFFMCFILVLMTKCC